MNSQSINPIQSRVVLLTTFLAFCTLYTLQPLLPQLVEVLDISAGEAALLVTVTLIPMGLAPVFYGFFLQAIPAKTMLRLALFFLILDQIALFFASQYWQLVVLRLLQGLILPALFTALMTYCSKMAVPDRVRSMMGWYVASTIVGGCLSRALSGMLATSFHWQWIFLILGIALIIPLFLTRKIAADAEVNFARVDSKAIKRVISQPTYTNAYLTLIFSFFAFGGILALIPFRLYEVHPGISSLTISLVYLGYVIGVPAAIYSGRLVQFFGEERRVLLFGLIFVAMGILGLLNESVWAPFFIMLPLAGGMFLIHSTLSGYINHCAGVKTSGDQAVDKGVVNGLYVCVYYVSGTLGSWLPVVAYQHFSWFVIIAALMCFLATSAMIATRLKQC